MARKAKQDSDDEPKKVAMHTLKLDAAQAAKLRTILVAKGWVSFPVDHAAFAFKGENSFGDLRQIPPSIIYAHGKRDYRSN